MRSVVLAIAVAACSSGGSSSPKPAPAPAGSRALANERAFARLYGALRWFYPGDEAAAIDWQRFAVYGAAQVRGAATVDALVTALDGLVRPIAPTVSIMHGASKVAVPAVPDDAPATWWQHVGPGLVGSASPYLTKRRGRPAPATSEANDFGVLTQAVVARPHRGAKVRLRGKLRATDGGAAQLWLRIDRANGTQGFFDNMSARPVSAAVWTDAEIVGDVADDASAIVFGVLTSSPGVTGFDEIELAVDHGTGWQPVAIDNGGFAKGFTGWGGLVPGSPRLADSSYAPATIPDGARGPAVSLSRVAAPPVTDEPFDHRPGGAEVVAIDLGDGLTANVPLVVAERDGHTVPAAAPGPLVAALAAQPALPDDDATRLADVVIAWNVFAHFYPYLDVIGEDWDKVLDDALRDALDDRTPDDHLATLERLVARAHDGHGNVIVPGRVLAAPLITVEWIEDRPVVVASAVDTVKRGDVIVTVDGTPATARLDDLISRRSGSPQWRRYRAVQDLLDGSEVPVALTVARGGANVDVSAPRQLQGERPPAFVRPAIGELEPGIWYVDLDRASSDEITRDLAKLAAARGVVFDLRGYPNGNHDILRNVITKPDTAKWMEIADMVRPFQRDVAGWERMTWGLAPTEPHLANVVFVTGPMAISYAESVLGYVEYEGLPIVGAASAGTNGNVRMFDLPGGTRVSFTGMRVVKHDGSQHHLIGVKPTIPAAATIAGIIAGRDEVLERAIAVVKK